MLGICALKLLFAELAQVSGNGTKRSVRGPRRTRTSKAIRTILEYRIAGSIPSSLCAPGVRVDSRIRDSTLRTCQLHGASLPGMRYVIEPFDSLGLGLQQLQREEE